jgi:uncharacterized protein YsxB (DUF464 family)
MTKIEIFFDNQERIQGFEVRGHTGFAAHGQDIVCAGISVLAQAAVLGLKHFLPRALAVEIADGLLACRLPAGAGLTQAEMEKAQVILTTTCLGFQAIKDSYGEYLSIVKKEV